MAGEKGVKKKEEELYVGVQSPSELRRVILEATRDAVEMLQNYEKFSFGWYFYIHISIPVIIFLRVKFGYSWKFIPLTLGGAVAGQLLGGIIHKQRNRNG